VVLSALLTSSGCAPRDAVFARPGITAATKKGTPVWARTDPEDTSLMRHSGSDFFQFDGMSGDEVRLHEGDASSKRMITVRQDDVILPENVPSGALSLNDEFSECPRIVRVLELDLDRKQAVIDCNGSQKVTDSEKLELIQPIYYRQRLVHWGYVLALWLWVVGLPMSTRLLRAGAERRRLADATAAKRRPHGKTLGHRDLEILTCRNCGGTVPLADKPETQCPHCRKPVTVPDEYVALVRESAQLNQLAVEHAKALRRLEIVSHPAFAIPMLLIGAGLVWAVRRAGDMTNETLAVFMPTMTGLVPGMLFGAIGQVVAFASVRKEKRGFLAVVDEKKQYCCRGCGAPLSSIHNGVGESCCYCGVQNLVLEASAAAAARAHDEAVQTDKSIGELVAETRLHVLEIARPLIFYSTLLTGFLAVILTILFAIVG
jgi:DNA-directed RNA polymerase subunit RPC12/RpoP